MPASTLPNARKPLPSRPSSACMGWFLARRQTPGYHDANEHVAVENSRTNRIGRNRDHRLRHSRGHFCPRPPSPLASCWSPVNAVDVKAVLVIPIFNHAVTIQGVIDSLHAAPTVAGEDLPLVLVNDGSTDSPPLSACGNEHAKLTILTHRRNCRQRRRPAHRLCPCPKTGFYARDHRGCRRPARPPPTC